MKILFLGGTGNISTECAALLHSQGHDVIVLSRGRTPVPPQYRAIEADRKNVQSLQAAAQTIKPDVVINFIGYEASDVETDTKVFDGRVSQYVFISSATVYAKPPKTLPITEEAPLGNAWWDYAQKKLACEQWLLGEQKKTGFPVTIVRPSHTYSKLWVPNPVSSGSYTFASRLEQGKPVFVPDDGENPWTLTATSDFAVGFAGLIGNCQAIGEAIHITSDEVLTWNQIYGEIAKALGAANPRVIKIPTDFICQNAPQLTGNLKGDKAHPAVFDNSKIKRLVPGFICRKSFALGIRESISWLRTHPNLQNLNPQVDETFERVIARFHSGAENHLRAETTVAKATPAV